MICKTEHCNKTKIKARGLCSRCYSKWYKKTDRGIKAESNYAKSSKGKKSALKKVLKYQNSESGKKVLEEYHQSKKYLDWSKNKCANRRFLKSQALPKWANLEEIENFYKNCPENYEVDHIIPLKNELVCGLHTLENLQYLTKSDNCKKRNNFDGTLENNSWRQIYDN